MALRCQLDSHLLVDTETLRRDWTQQWKFKDRRGRDKVEALESTRAWSGKKRQEGGPLLGKQWQYDPEGQWGFVHALGWSNAQIIHSTISSATLRVLDFDYTFPFGALQSNWSSMQVPSYSLFSIPGSFLHFLSPSFSSLVCILISHHSCFQLFLVLHLRHVTNFREWS